MNLYIKTENGNPVNHPAFEDNLIQAFGSVPNHWEPFVRVERPTSELYQVVSDQPTYKKVDGVWTDVWTIRDMTAEEKAALQKPVKDAWAIRPFSSNFTAWVYDESTNSYQPPIPQPTDAPKDQMYRWSGVDNNWKLAPWPPNDGKLYQFNFDNWVYEEVISEQQIAS